MRLTCLLLTLLFLPPAAGEEMVRRFLEAEEGEQAPAP